MGALKPCYQETTGKECQILSIHTQGRSAYKWKGSVIGANIGEDEHVEDLGIYHDWFYWPTGSVCSILWLKYPVASSIKLVPVPSLRCY